MISVLFHYLIAILDYSLVTFDLLPVSHGRTHLVYCHNLDIQRKAGSFVGNYLQVGLHFKQLKIFFYVCYHLAML